MPQADHRPLRLFWPPRPIDVLAVLPDGPPVRFHDRHRRYEVARHWGPERIQTAWWRGRSVQRDYYRVEVTGSGRFWLFRQLDDLRWFLHGEFV